MLKTNLTNATLLLITILISGLAVDGQSVTSKYDRFKDETRVEAVIGDSPIDMQFQSAKWLLAVTFKGKLPPASPDAELVLAATSKYGIFANDRDLRAIADDERLLLGTMIHVGVPYRGTVIDTASLKIPLSTLKKLSAAKKVEFQAGSLEWLFSEKGLMAIKAFVEFFDTQP